MISVLCIILSLEPIRKYIRIIQDAQAGARTRISPFSKSVKPPKLIDPLPQTLLYWNIGSANSRTSRMELVAYNSWPNLSPPTAPVYLLIPGAVLFPQRFKTHTATIAHLVYTKGVTKNKPHGSDIVKSNQLCFTNLIRLVTFGSVDNDSLFYRSLLKWS